MRDPFTFEERVALWVLACVAVAFVFAANQAGAAEAPPVPKSMPQPPAPRIYSFSARATDVDGVQSVWSDEHLWTNTVKARVVLVELTPGFSEYPVTNFSVRFKKPPGTQYVSTNHFGTNTIGSVRIAKEPVTNRVFAVSTVSTGMFYADKLSGPWTYTSETNVLHLNPKSGNRFYRAVTGGTLTWQQVWF